MQTILSDAGNIFSRNSITDWFQFLDLIMHQISLTVSYFTHRGCFCGIWFFRFVARHQVSVCRNVLNQLQQSGAWVRTCPHMNSVVRHAQFHLRVTLNKKKTHGTVKEETQMSIDVYRNENNFNTALCSDTWSYSINASEARGFSKSNANWLEFKQLDLHNEVVRSVSNARSLSRQMWNIGVPTSLSSCTAFYG